MKMNSGDIPCISVKSGGRFVGVVRHRGRPAFCLQNPLFQATPNGEPPDVFLPISTCSTGLAPDLAGVLPKCWCGHPQTAYHSRRTAHESLIVGSLPQPPHRRCLANPLLCRCRVAGPPHGCPGKCRPFADRIHNRSSECHGNTSHGHVRLKYFWILARCIRSKNWSGHRKVPGPFSLGARPRHAQFTPGCRTPLRTRPPLSPSDREYTPARSADKHLPEAHWRRLSILSPAVTATGTTFCAA